MDRKCENCRVYFPISLKKSREISSQFLICRTVKIVENRESKCIRKGTECLSLFLINYISKKCKFLCEWEGLF